MTGIDEAFATMARLKAAAFLAGCAEAEFGVVAQKCDIAASALSKAAITLEEAGYVRIRKGHVGRRPRTWLALTAVGLKAFEAHLAALAELTNQGRALTGRETGTEESPSPTG
ncbi:transcriptional regulator [Nocardia sp. NPDC101769]|uniref:transcriptional regulator n=1 Tax=Nocardia sp. NPDC101769 TaxID=3364333 RepID=UPI00382B86FD